jgi:molybdate transport system regulatory protein
MSYRAAWGKIKKTEEVLGVRLIEKKGGNRSGYRLTEEGRLLASAFQQWFQEVETYALKCALNRFPCEPRRFKEPRSKSLPTKTPRSSSQ